MRATISSATAGQVGVGDEADRTRRVGAEDSQTVVLDRDASAFEGVEVGTEHRQVGDRVVWSGPGAALELDPGVDLPGERGAVGAGGADGFDAVALHPEAGRGFQAAADRGEPGLEDGAAAVTSLRMSCSGLASGPKEPPIR